MKKTIFFIFTICYLLSGIGFAQWQQDVRLTNDPSNSNTSNNNAWNIAGSGFYLYAVWEDNRDGNPEIYFKRSTDQGISWSADFRLTTNTAESSFPSVFASGSFVHVVWSDNRDGGNNYEIYYKRSTDLGVNWEPIVRISNDPAFSDYHSISGGTGQSVYIVWEDSRHNDYEIYFRASTDEGATWGSENRLTTHAGNSLLPSITAIGPFVNVVWQDDRDGNREIYYKRSTDRGINWDDVIRLTNNPFPSQVPSISKSSSLDVHVVWEDVRDGNGEIYYKKSTDSGVNWGPDIRLTNNSATSIYPSIIASGSIIHIAWEENRDNNPEIYYKRSTDMGVSWGSDTRLTNNGATSYSPSVFAFNSNVHVIWYDNRDGNNEIYYKRNPSGNVVGIKNLESEIPKEFGLSQNYPNPFNPNTKISFQIAISSFALLKVYDLNGREVATLVNEYLKPGTYEVKFDGSNFSSGIYYYILSTGDFSETRKMILIK